MATFPPPDLNAAMNNPTVQTTDPATGYQFDTTSPAWKTACAVLPSFAALEWPGYATTCVPATINGKQVVIQPWMGRCQQFFSRGNYPGGVGGEVGVYAVVPGGRSLPDLSLLPGPIQVIFRAMAALGGTNVWWPDPDVQPEIDFTILNPLTNTPLLRADPENNYWVNKWMEPASYDAYTQSVGGQVPSPRQYKMVYTVDGVTREWVPAPNQG
jgi:hypothetical protein